MNVLPAIRFGCNVGVTIAAPRLSIERVGEHCFLSADSHVTLLMAGRHHHLAPGENPFLDQLTVSGVDYFYPLLVRSRLAQPTKLVRLHDRSALPP